jgi:predicted permease
MTKVRRGNDARSGNDGNQPMIANFMQDLRYSLRTLAAKPSFAIVAVLTLALGIGANTAIFSVIHGMFLRPLPYPGGERLVNVYNTYPKMGVDIAGTSIPDYLDRKKEAPSLEDLAIYTGQSYNLAESGSTPERLPGQMVSPSFFTTLQVAPMLGQAFTDAHAVPGQDKAAVISYALWSNRFNRDPSVIGRDVRLNGEPYRVIGVMPEGFAFPNSQVQVWVPFAFTADQMSDNARGNEFSNSVGRLKPGATVEQLNREMDTIVARNVERLNSPQFNARDFVAATGFTGRSVSLREQQVGPARTMLLVLQAAVGMVLLIACANVANLMLTRVVARQKELSVRNALGATRWRIARQLLVDALVLSGAGGLLGLVLAYASIGAMPALGIGSSDGGGDYAFRIDGTVLLFALFAAGLAGVLAAVLPMYSLLRLNINDVIKEGGRLGSGGRRAAASRNVLVIAQIALATMLLIGAGLLLKSFKQLQERSPGFDSHGLLTAMISLPPAKYPDDAARVRFFDEALRELRALPGVQRVGFVQSLPFSGNNSQGSYNIEGYTVAGEEASPHAFQRNVDEDYFKAMSIPLLQGRVFTAADNAGAAPVVVIDRLLAEKYFKGQDPIGKRLTRDDVGVGNDSPPIWATVIGVVSNIKHTELKEEAGKETVYWPLRQVPQSQGAFVVKSAGATDLLVKPVREAILKVDPEQPIYSVQTLDQRIASSLDQQRAPMLLLALFAGVALALSAIGIYGVLAYSVGQRTGELGVRMAIGAGRPHILKLILRHGALLTVVGLTLGLIGAFAGGQAMRSQLFGVSGADPGIFALVTLFLAAIAMLSCWLPARRATRVDPLAALRHT